MAKKQTQKLTREQKLEMIKQAANNIERRRTSSLLRDERQTYEQMVRECVENPDPVRTEVRRKKPNSVPSCSRRRVAPNLGDYESSEGSKMDVEGARSVDLSTPMSLDPETALVTNREVERKVNILEIAVASAIEDDGENKGSGEHPAVPECSIRRAAPSMDDYVNKGRKKAEGSRSVDLSVLRDNPEEKSED